MSKNLSEGSIIVELGPILLFSFGVEDVFRKINEPVAELDLSVK